MIRPDVAAVERTRGAVLANGDAESVHDLRVALARVDAWLLLAGEKRLRARVKTLRRAAARVRDLDVLVAVEPLLGTLASWRPGMLKTLQNRLRSPRTATLVDALRKAPEIAEGDAAAALAKRAGRIARDGRRALRGSKRRHRLRRKLRRVRYAAEMLGREAGAVKRTVSLLGTALDHARAAEMLDAIDVPRAKSHRESAREGIREVREAWGATRDALRRMGDGDAS